MRSILSACAGGRNRSGLRCTCDWIEAGYRAEIIQPLNDEILTGRVGI
jgi:hypothetical protein